ncbi:MAG: TIGR03619 family F420-dependent LLM class oxidoreductase [Actinobacteria bacterium]|nr:TIGR03619 family F420-dependent LLM class oxidoreductase [Actinomycetota bacterium]
MASTRTPGGPSQGDDSCDHRPVKVRIGFGLGAATRANEPSTFAALVDALERLRFDSLWLSERLTGDAPDPLVALAFAAGRTHRLKLGTSVLVVPGRNPVVLAKELASLDRLSGGRLLPAVGLGAPNPAEHSAFGVQRGERAAWFDEALGLMRRLWVEDSVTHEGARFRVEGVTLRPRPVQQPIDVWLGGTAPSELRRTGRLGDGWLPSFCTVADVRDGWPIICAEARRHGRTVDPEHLGALIAYSHTEVPDAVRTLLRRRRPDLDPTEVVPVGLSALRARVEAFCAAGASKFVVLPLADPPDWDDELGALAEVLKPLET